MTSIARAIMAAVLTLILGVIAAVMIMNMTTDVGDSIVETIEGDATETPT